MSPLSESSPMAVLDMTETIPQIRMLRETGVSEFAQLRRRVSLSRMRQCKWTAGQESDR